MRIAGSEQIYFRREASQLLVFAGLAFASLCAAQPGVAETEPSFAGKLRPLIHSAMKSWVTPGAIVLVEVPGETAWIEAFGVSDLATKTPMSPDDHQRIGSVTKTLTGESVLLLVDDGKIGLDDPIEKYLPGLVPNGPAITIRQMLNMTSGIYNGTEDAAFNVILDAKPEAIWTPRDFIALSLTHPPYFAPGGGFHYSNTNYELLGLVVEQQSGEPLDRFMAERIFKPLGMANTSLPRVDQLTIPDPHGRGYFFGTNVDGVRAYDAMLAGDPKNAFVPWPVGKPPVDATDFSPSYIRASGSAISTLGDMQIWAKALASGALLTPQTRKEQTKWSAYAHYGLGITEPVGAFLGHNGAIPGYQTLIGYDPRSGATIVVFTNNQLEPNTEFVLPADAIAGIIDKALSH